MISFWLILAAFELAALYGAVKIMNPLGERCRAAFLVSSILQLLFFLGMAFLLKGDIADGPLAGLFWIGLAVWPVLSIASFVLARMRRTIVALAALYIAHSSPVSLFAAGLSSKLQAHRRRIPWSWRSSPDGLSLVSCGVSIGREWSMSGRIISKKTRISIWLLMVIHQRSPQKRGESHG